MHIADLDLGHLGANGIVGGGVPIAVGAALGFQHLQQDHVAVALFGDGAINQGSFHEAANLASLWKLPVVFVCENNQFGMTTPLREASAQPDLASRAVAYNIPGRRVDGMDVRAVKEATSEAAERARCGEGPSLLVMETYRYEGHYVLDPTVYRTKEDVEAWKERDAIGREQAYLLEAHRATEEELEQIRREVAAELEDAVAFALDSPDPSPDELYTDVYSD